MELTWAGKRKVAVISIFTAVGVLIFFGIGFAIFYEVPSCTDNKQNQSESGVDCGGECNVLCNLEVKAPRVLFTRVLEAQQPGRTDIIAYVENSNANASLIRGEATLELYDESRRLIFSDTVLVTIPPSSTVPIFIPGIFETSNKVAQAFLTFNAPLRWNRASTTQPLPLKAESIAIQESQTPRVTAVLTNASAKTMRNITVIATVFGATGNTIAASKTLVLSVGAQSSAPLVFTWNVPFPDLVSRVEIVPLVDPLTLVP